MKKVHIICLLLFVSGQLLAQEQALPTSEKEVLKKFNAKLANAKKLKRTFELPTQDEDRTYLKDYLTSDKTVSLDYAKPDIKALAMDVEPESEISRFYVEGAMGLPLNPYGAASYALSRENLDVILSGTYFSYDHDSYKNTTDIDINLASNFIVNDMFKIELGGGYDIMQRGLITNLDSSTFENRKFDGFHVGLAASNSQQTRSEINYKLGYNLENWKDNFNHDQYKHNLLGAVDKRLNEFWSAKITGDVQYTTFKIDTFKSEKTTIAGIHPSLILSKPNYALELGVWVGTLDDEFTYLPNLDFTYTINAKSSIHAGLKSGYIQQDFKYSTKINPYISYDRPHIVTQTHMSPYVGLQISKSGYLVDIEASYHITKDFQHFSNDTLQNLIPVFNTVYSDVNFIGLRAQVSKKLNNGLDVSLAYKHRIKQDKDIELLHTPFYDATLNFYYNELFDKKLGIHTAFIFEGGRKYFGDEEIKTLDPILDLNIRADYSINKNTAVYLGCRNLLNNKTALFYQYERIGINPYIGAWLKL